MKAILALLCLCALSWGAVIQNGSFETGVDPGSFKSLAAGSTEIDGWVVGGNGIDYIGSYWQASDGSRSIDMSLAAGGSISQTFATVLGGSYVVQFDIAGNPDGGPVVKSLVTSADGTQQMFTFDTTGSSLGDMNWSTRQFAFIATGVTTTLTFMGADTTPFGAALDNVSISAVPEPGSVVLLAPALAGLFWAVRRRNR